MKAYNVAQERKSLDSYDKNYFKRYKNVNVKTLPCFKIVKTFLTRGEVIVDIGCGSGLWLKELGENYKFKIGIDISRDALIESHKNVPNADLMLASAHSLPFRDDVFDVTLNISVIEHLPVEDAKKSLKEIARTMKAGGVFICITPNAKSFVHRLKLSYDPTHQHLYTFDELQNLVTSYGFKIEDLRFSALTTKLGIYRLLKAEIILKCRKRKTVS